MKEIFRIWPFIKPHAGSAVHTVVFNLLAIVFALFSFSLFIPFLGVLFDTQALVTTSVPLDSFSALKHNFYYLLSSMVTDYGKSKALLLVVGIAVAASLFKNASLLFANYSMGHLMNVIVKDLQVKVYHKLTKLPLSYFSDERKGNIMARITNDVEEIRISVQSTLDLTFRDPLSIIINLTALFVMNAQLTLVVLLLLPVSGLIIGTIGRKLRGYSKKGKDSFGTLISIVEETLSGLKIIKAFGAEKMMSRRFDSHVDGHSRLLTKIHRMYCSASPISEFLGMSAIMFVLYYGSNMVLQGESNLSPQGFIGYLIIFSQIIAPAKALSNSYYNIQRGLASLDRMNEILHADDLIADCENPVHIEKFSEAIQFNKVSFRYKEAYVLKDIDLKIGKGQIVALVGHSGSGKSTLADLVPRFWDVEEGEISIDGYPIKSVSLESLRRQIGYVNQEPILFNDTIFNNIAFGVEGASMDDVIAAAKVANAHEFIMETPHGYQSNIGDRGNKLSGGQRQRLSIARAVLKNPPILILDEATSALDTESERLVQTALTSLMQNRSSLVIAHRLSTITHADLICVMRDGEIVERGTHQELIEMEGYYKKLQDMQIFQQ